MLPAPVALFDLPHREAQARVRDGGICWLTVNPVEYHGPHLSLHNDRLVSLGLLRRMHTRSFGPGSAEGPLVASDLELGAEPCPGPGTRQVAFLREKEHVLDACGALLRLGARRVVLMTFHGAPLHNLALEAGAAWLRRHGVPAVAPFHAVMAALVELDPAEYAPAFAGIADDAERAIMLAGLPLDFHAGFFETSVALRLAPDSVSPSHRLLPPCPDWPEHPVLRAASRVAGWMGRRRLAAELALAARVARWFSLRPFPGYTGRPHRASAEAGDVFVDALVEKLSSVIQATLFRGEAAPAPVMAWMAAATLGGRLLPASAPWDSVSDPLAEASPATTPGPAPSPAA